MQKPSTVRPVDIRIFEERGHLTTILHAYSSQLEGVPIPDICHEPHEHVRVNFFGPV